MLVHLNAFLAEAHRQNHCTHQSASCAEPQGPPQMNQTKAETADSSATPAPMLLLMIMDVGSKPMQCTGALGSMCVIGLEVRGHAVNAPPDSMELWHALPYYVGAPSQPRGG